MDICDPKQENITLGNGSSPGVSINEGSIADAFILVYVLGFSCKELLQICVEGARLLVLSSSAAHVAERGMDKHWL